jgi:ATP-binding cassette subfamily B protein
MHINRPAGLQHRCEGGRSAAKAAAVNAAVNAVSKTESLRIDPSKADPSKATAVATAVPNTPAVKIAGTNGVPAPDVGTLRELWRFKDYARPERLPLVGGVAMRWFELAADLAAPWPLALLIDDLLRKGRKRGPLHEVAQWFGGSAVAMLIVAAVAVLVITAASGLFDYLGDTLMNGAGERITSRIRSDVFGYVERLPMAFHERQAIGELTSRVVSDTSRIESSLLDLFTDLIPAVLTLVGTAAVLLSVSWELGLIGLCVAPLVYVMALRFARLTRRNSRRKRAAVGKLTGFVTESLQGIRTVHAFGNQARQDELFGSSNDTVLRLGLRSVDLSARFSPVLQAVGALGTAGVLFVGGYGVLHNWWAAGILIVVTSYLKNILSPMKTLAKLAPRFTAGAASAEWIAAILDEPGEHLGTPEALPRRVSGRIQLRGVAGWVVGAGCAGALVAPTDRDGAAGHLPVLRHPGCQPALRPP